MGYNQSDWVPLDLLGYLDNAIETAPRRGDFSVTLTSGRIYLSYVTAYRTQAITQLGTVCRLTAVGTLTSHRLGVYTIADSGDLTLAARTASQVAGTYSSTLTEYPYALDTTGGFPATYVLQKGVRYAFGMITVFASTAPAVKGDTVNLATATLIRPPRLSAHVAGQTDLLTTITAASFGSTNDTVYQFALA